MILPHRSRPLMAALLSCVLSLPAVCAAGQSSWKFDFGPGAAVPGYTKVLPSEVYSADRGYGFDFGFPVKAVERKGNNPLKDGFVTSNRPFFFSVKLPEGNYRVTMTFGDPDGSSVATVKAESRRLMVQRVATEKGGFATRTIIVNIRNHLVPPPPPNAPGGDHVILDKWEKVQGPGGGLVLDWDNKLSLEFDPAKAGGDPCLSSLTIAPANDVPTIFLAGDSTVTDQARGPTTSWGQMLTRFFKPTVAVANYAESGETMKSFISELRLAKILSKIKKGDYLFIQFAHNDEKKSWPQTYVEAHTTYKAYLKVFIAEARLRGAHPVLVTPMQRRFWTKDNKIRNTHGFYPEAMREVAAEKHVPLIDLEKMSVKFYEALGRKEAPLAFGSYGKDHTHQSAYGAYEFAKCIIEGIRQDHLPLASDIVDSFKGFDPAHPDSPQAFDVPVTPFTTGIRPRGN